MTLSDTSTTDDQLVLRLRYHLHVEVPAQRLDEAILPKLTAGHKISRRGRSVPIRAIGLAAIAAAFALIAVLTLNPLSGPAPPTVSARTVVQRAARAVLPAPGHTTISRYVIALRCGPKLHCPRAIGIRWTANFSGVDVSEGNVRVRTYGKLGRQTFDRNDLVMRPSHEYGYYGGGGGFSEQLQRGLEDRFGIAWLPDAFQDVWSGLNSLEVPTELRSLAHRLSYRYRPGHIPNHLITATGQSLASLVNFHGSRTYKLRLPGAINLGLRAETVYVDARSYLVRGIKGSSCVRVNRRGAALDGSIGKCTDWINWRVLLKHTRTMPYCSGPAKPFRFYLDGRDGTSPAKRAVPKCS